MTSENVALLLFLLLVLFVLALSLVPGLPPLEPVQVLILVLLCSLLVLSGCGTAPLQVQTSPPVPAGLLTHPRPPVLLKPALPSTTPGKTTPPTPGSAPKTGSTINA